jgi:hypothetical protein
MRTLAALLFAATLAVAADKPKAPEPGKAVPDTTPLEATIEGTMKYTLTADAKSEADLKKAFAVDQVPPAPKVDLKLVVKNTSKDTIQVWNAGDSVKVTLSLTGKGAVSHTPRLAFTTDFKLPKAVKVEAGKSVEFPIKALVGGFRGGSEYSYWTAAGEYELTATLSTGVSPAPKGADAADDGFGVVQVASKAVKITVEAKK